MLDKSCGGFAAVFVPLYLVLLAFFILLNTISEIEQTRKTEAIGSVQKTFKVVQRELEMTIDLPFSVGRDIPIRHFFSPMGDVVRDTLRLVETDQVVMMGNHMQVTLSSNKFFIDETADIQKSMRPFITKVADQMVSMTEAHTIDLEIIFPIYPTTNANLQSANTLSMRRAGEFARILVELGIDPERIIVGGSTIPKNDMQLSFYKRPNNAGTSIVPGRSDNGRP